MIAGGYGMGSKEGFDKLFELAKELHAEVGASRAAVDAGYADHVRRYRKQYTVWDGRLHPSGQSGGHRCV